MTEIVITPCITTKVPDIELSASPPKDRSTGVPIKHFGDDVKVAASLILWPDGTLSIRINAENRIFEQISPTTFPCPE